MKFGLMLATLIAAFVTLPAVAKDEPEPAVNANTKASFDTVSAWVRKQMEGGGRYAELNAGERSKVDAKLDEMGRMFEQHGDVAQMSDGDKTRLYNNQQEVNALLNKRDGERLICKSERPVGSNIPVKTCNTAANIAARQRTDTQDFRRRQDAQAQTRGGN